MLRSRRWNYGEAAIDHPSINWADEFEFDGEIP